ncbi:NAD-binding Rossmann fold oxidoreductase family protein [Penicillium longicatenatum]|nr:NAD-binding Rossmann fold oxidoreductase family protein [Penicillium longicatenatum]
MAPIRVGFIGLSPGQWAAKAHLPYLQSFESKFEIVAVCNSSAESAVKAAKELKLAEGVRTCGNPQDLANDKEIDLVVCTTRVDRHHQTIIPSLKAGKDVYVEWPLGKSLQEAQDLLNIARQNNVKNTAVGLQGRFDSTIETLKEILGQGKIGRVLSTSINAQGMIGGPTEIATYEYLIDQQVGGNLFSIPASHLLDAVREVLGELSSFQSLLSNQLPVVKLVDFDGSTVKENVKKTTPDHVLIQGTLNSGAVLSATTRGGMPFKDAPGMEWSIYGEKGEIRVKGPNAHIQIYGATSIELHDFQSDKVEKIEPVRGTFAEMPPTHRNVARVYEAISAGDKSVLCEFEGAVKRHEFIEEIYKQNAGVV